MNKYSYSGVEARLKAFADAHYIVQRYSVGEDLDFDQTEGSHDGKWPLMHVIHPTIVESYSGKSFQVQLEILFADLPREFEGRTEQQVKVISDLVRIAQDLAASILNGPLIMGDEATIVGDIQIETIGRTRHNSVCAVRQTFTLELPNDFSACDVPASFILPSGGGGNQWPWPFPPTGDWCDKIVYCPVTQYILNQLELKLESVEVDGVTITGDGTPGNPLTAVGGGGGGTGTVTSVDVTADGDAITPTGGPVTDSGTINLGFNGADTDYIDGEGNLQPFPTIPPPAPVDSVNGQTGVVVLDAGDVGADPAGSAATAESNANAYTDQELLGYVQSVTGDIVDNADQQNPVLNVAVDGTTIVGTGGAGNPLAVVAAGGAASVVGGSGIVNLVALSTLYITPYAALISDILSQAERPIQLSGTIDRFCIQTAIPQDASGSLVCTLYRNGSPTSVSVTIPAGGPADVYVNTTDSISVSIGDLLAIEVVNNATLFSSSVITATQFRITTVGVSPGAIDFETNGTPNGDQTLLNLAAGSNITLTDDGNGNVTFDADNDAASWGNIGGTLSNQTDLQTALNGKQNIPVIVTTSLTAANDTYYNLAASATFTDPTPVADKGFTVLIVNGTATIGGLTYSQTGMIVQRVYHSGSWRTYTYGQTEGSCAMLTSSFSTASDSMVNVTGLVVPARANQNYRLTAAGRCGCDNTGGLRFYLTPPTGANINGAIVGRTSAFANLGGQGVSFPSGSESGTFANTNSSFAMIQMEGAVLMAGNAGNIQLQIRSNTSGQTSTLDAGFFIEIWKAIP